MVIVIAMVGAGVAYKRWSDSGGDEDQVDVKQIVNENSGGPIRFWEAVDDEKDETKGGVYEVPVACPKASEVMYDDAGFIEKTTATTAKPTERAGTPPPLPVDIAYDNPTYQRAAAVKQDNQIEEACVGLAMYDNTINGQGFADACRDMSRDEIYGETTQ